MPDLPANPDVRVRLTLSSGLRAEGSAPGDGADPARHYRRCPLARSTAIADLAVETLGLTKEFVPGVGAIDVDLRVPRGLVYGFLGPNGAGKSTTIRMMTGVLPPDRGYARVLGLDPFRDEVEIQRRIGVLPSDSQYPRHHTGRSLVRHLAGIRGDQKQIVNTANAVAERFELDLSKRAHELSLGNRQKLGLVIAMMHDPELLILDEPTNGLDPIMQRELDSFLRELADTGRTVLLSSHQLAEVERVADHVGFIRNAILVEQTSLAELSARAIRRIFFTFDHAPNVDAFNALEGVNDAEAIDLTLSLTHHGPVADILRVAAEQGATTVEAKGADLEATFLELYEDAPEEATKEVPA